MARLASEQIAGFFALPESVAPLIAERLAPSEADSGSVFRLLDPCCGEGVALASIAASLAARATAPVKTYGIELHPGRARAASERLDTVALGDIFAAETGQFDLVYLNPPYVHGTMEQRFLARAIRMLAPGALLALVVQKKTLRNCARILAANFGEITIREFPLPERDVFGQIVLTARRAEFVIEDPETQRNLEDYARSEFGDPERQYRPEDIESPALILPGPASDEPGLVIRTHSANHVLEVARAAGYWTAPDVLDSQRPGSGASRQQPLAPLRMGHLAQYCGAGLLNNTLIEDFVISGTATKTKTRTEDENQVVITENIKLTLMALDLDDWTTHKIT